MNFFVIRDAITTLMLTPISAVAIMIPGFWRKNTMIFADFRPVLAACSARGRITETIPVSIPAKNPCIQMKKSAMTR